MNTWEEHRDYQNLSSVLTDIKLIANFVNESMKIGDIVTRVYEIDLASRRPMCSSSLSPILNIIYFTI